MKYHFVSILVFFCQQASAQKSDSCVSRNLPHSQDLVYLKGIVHQDSIFVEKDVFKNGVVLYSESPSVKLIGYKVVTGCPGCEIISFTVCGEKMDNISLAKLLRYFSEEGDTLIFENINVEKECKRYLARPFMVYFKK